MLRRNLFISLILLLLMIIYLVTGHIIYNNKDDQSITHITEEHNIVDLTGKWLFNKADNHLFSQRDIDDKNWDKINVPGLWNFQGYNHNGSSWFRYYFTTDSSRSLSMVVPKVIAGYEVYLNGELIGGLGKISTDGKLIEEETHINLIELPSDLIMHNELNSIAIRVSTISADGGFVEAPFKLGDKYKLQRYFQRYLLYYTAIAAILFFVGIYFTIVYIVDRTYKHNLLFGIMGVFCSIFVIGQKSLGYWITNNHWINLLGFIYIPLSLLPYVLISMVHSFFRKPINKVIKLIMNCYLLIPIILMLVPLDENIYIFFFENVVICIYVVTIFVLGYSMLISDYAINTKLPGSQGLSIGISIFSVTAIVNALANSGFVVLYDPLSEGLLFLCLFMSIAASLEISSIRLELSDTNMALTLHNKSLHRFVPFEFFTLLNKWDILEIKAGDNRAIETTVLFTDIRAFTTLSEKMTPKENFEFINDYLEHMVPVINNHNGFVDKYIGDAIMAIFPASPDHAVNAAIAMQKELVKFNQKREASYKLPIEMGIGIHYGKLMLGIIGNETRLEGTVISDTVNIASRIENLTKMFSSHILISNDLFLQLNDLDSYKYRFMGMIDIKGKTDSVSVFEIFNGDDEEMIEKKIETKDEFEKGILNFSNNKILEAKNIFEKVLEYNGHDKTAHCFLEMIKVKEMDQNLNNSIEYYNEITNCDVIEELEEV